MTEDLRQRIEGNERWGWIIYRTVYTSTSDQHWGEVKKRLDGLILEDFDRMNIASTRDLVLAAAAREKYQNIILDDKEKFNNVSWELLETHFKEWVPTSSPRFSREGDKNATWKGCLIIDEAAISTILNAPSTDTRIEQDSLFKESPEKYSITFVGLAEEPFNYEFDYETGEEHWLDEEDPEYDIVPSRTWPGHYPVSIFRLYGFWERLSLPGTWAEDEWHSIQRRKAVVWSL